ncbi:MAG TPA: DNA primase small subunit domain-containing protein [Nitrososphaera sp.]|nr:DNA primase small subunit domain-containing protein [Nitrososphaera sp.]
MREDPIAVKTISVIKKTFREYYFNQSNAIEEPVKIELREFGFMHFGQAGMLRHLSFKSMKELYAMLVREAPSDVYCSNAYYQFPTQQPMQEKLWLGADLIFDIDGKDLGMPCVPSHSYSVCIHCGYVSTPQQDEEERSSSYLCPSCGCKKADHVSIPCSKCIDGSKKETRRLMDFLLADIGLERSAIEVYFSGNNGFHLKINDDACSSLDPQARSDLVGYLCGTGLMLENIGVRKTSAGEGLFSIKFPKSGLAYGWRRRIAEKLKIGMTSATKLKNIVNQYGGYSGFKVELERLARDMGVRVDPQVTTDVHRVFRMPGTLNSKSGLSKVKSRDLNSFDPFLDACLLGDGIISVRVKTPVKLKLRRSSFNISKESAELPAYAAVYLMCKGLAEAN